MKCKNAVVLECVVMDLDKIGKTMQSFTLFLSKLSLVL